MRGGCVYACMHTSIHTYLHTYIYIYTYLGWRREQDTSEDTAGRKGDNILLVSLHSGGEAKLREMGVCLTRAVQCLSYYIHTSIHPSIHPYMKIQFTPIFPCPVLSCPVLSCFVPVRVICIHHLSWITSPCHLAVWSACKAIRNAPQSITSTPLVVVHVTSVYTSPHRLRYFDSIPTSPPYYSRPQQQRTPRHP
jgi:hypothetical protein